MGNSEYSTEQVNLGMAHTIFTTVAILWLSSRSYAATESAFNGTNDCAVNADCLPWTECNNSKCVCKEIPSSQSIKCDKETLQLSVANCHCLTFDDETEEMVEGLCIENCEFGSEGREYVQLPLNASELNQFMCEERWNRTGRLCGSCLPGHSPLAYSHDMRCIKCPEGNRNIWKYILAAFGPLTIFYFVVLFLKINATSSLVHGCFIVISILSNPYSYRTVVIFVHAARTNSEKMLLQFGATIYGIGNLDFFRLLYPDICLDVSPLTVLALDYAVAIYPLLLTVLSYILIELHARNVRIVVILWKPFRFVFTLVRRNWDSKTTVIDSFATFFLLSFIKIAWTSADLLAPISASTFDTRNGTFVLFYDASVEYFGEEHLPYAVLAITLFTVFLVFPILVLLIYPFRCSQNVLSCLKIRSHMLQAILNSFQGCYKDGTEPGTRDYRWFSAVPLIVCIFFVVLPMFLFQSIWFLSYIAVCVILMIVIGIIQPYKTQFAFYSKIDLSFWGLLALFFTVCQADTTEATQVLLYIILHIPLLYILCVSVYWILSRMRKVKTLISRIKAWRRGYTNIDFHEESLPDRMVNPEHYQEESLQDPVGDVRTKRNDTY